MEGNSSIEQTESSTGGGEVESAPIPSTPEPQEGGQGEALPQAAEAPQWTPNWKYKAGGEEKEIPEWLRSAVKNQEHEKSIRELHEKVFGFDKLKGTHTKLEQQYQQIMPEYKGMKSTIEKVITYRDNGDLDSFFEATGVSKQAVAQWMLKELQLQEMSAEQRAVYENEQKLRKHNYALQEQVANLSESQRQEKLQAHAASLHTALARPEVQSVMNSFNARIGQPDAFWNFVCQQAHFLETTGGKPVTADEAVEASLKILGGTQAPGQAPQASYPQNPMQGAGSPTPPVIPNVSGRNSSPTKKVARSIDDLKKLAKEMA